MIKGPKEPNIKGKNIFIFYQVEYLIEMQLKFKF